MTRDGMSALKGLSIVTAALVLCGCASSSNMPKLVEPGSGRSVVQPTSALPEAVVEKAPGIITITFPSRVSGAALAAVEGRYNSLTLGFNAPYGERGNTRALQSALLRSSYIAHELYRKFAQIVPKESIVLAPGTVTIADGKLGYLVETGTLPTALQIDVMEYVAPKTFWGLPQAGSRGIVVSPLFEVTIASADARHRRVAISRPIATSTQAIPSVFNALLHTQDGGRDPTARDKPIHIPWVEALPSDTVWNAHVNAKAGERPIYGEVTFEELVGAVKKVLLSDAWRSDYLAAEQAYFDQFRRAVETAGGKPNPQTDVALLRRFLAAEVKFASRSGFSTLDALFEGSWGDALRASLSAETEVYKGMAAAIRRSALAPAGDLPSALANISFTQTQVADMNRSYAEAFSPVLAKAETVQMSAGGATQAISAKSAKELRDRLVEIYLKSASRPPA